jgi:hypothetical protein
LQGPGQAATQRGAGESRPLGPQAAGEADDRVIDAHASVMRRRPRQVANARLGTLPCARRSYPAMARSCRFRTSFGGAQFCQDPPYLEGFCRFHFDALRRGEINELGVIDERVSDQARRREINYHGIRLPGETYLEDRR